ncbi:GNAT family N-acetyltransferase [Rufibacter hautae]|uniref:GNAT family N-acetyltransferase n=1 Tax=Rufibacter hautae TaxID=2595005 RepID=A0A5B6T9P3_9BACT|nr:GNAT family N-acetyltransferase [Rufibacter hautae]KAA3436655.1 GNAT family N-acetyltransferase [Rufibacter hautae]
MLTLKAISTTATPGFSQAWQWYEEAFPPEERRTLEQQTQLFTDSAYRFLAIMDQEEFAGFFGIWQLSGFTFLEHFAVVPSHRGKGTGSKALAILLETIPPPVLLEVEPPHSEIAQRRIRFYERLGFLLNDFEYRQPPYVAGMHWVPLLLMSYPSALDPSELEKVKGQLYNFVYQQAV